MQGGLGVYGVLCVYSAVSETNFKRVWGSISYWVWLGFQLFYNLAKPPLKTLYCNLNRIQFNFKKPFIYKEKLNIEIKSTQPLLRLLQVNKLLQNIKLTRAFILATLLHFFLIRAFKTKSLVVFSLCSFFLLLFICIVCFVVCLF